MNKKQWSLGVVFLLSLFTTNMLKGQTFDSAYRYSNELLVSGSARYMSMGGAFGALGADISALRQNPAGLGMFRSNDIQITLGLNSSSTDARWYDNADKNTKTKYLGSASIVLANIEGNSGLNLFFSYHTRNQFHRSFSLESGVATPFSLADYAAYISPSSVREEDLFNDENNSAYSNSGAPWLAILGHTSGWTMFDNGQYQSAFVYPGQYGQEVASPLNSSIKVQESGSVLDYDFGMSGNIDNRFYFGATFKFSSLRYSMLSRYEELFPQQDYLVLSNSLSTNGSGFGVSLGAILRLTDSFRLGFSYTTPTYFVMTDVYNAGASSRYSAGVDANGDPLPESKWVMESYTPDHAKTHYYVKTPSKFIFSAAALLSNRGVIDAEFEMSNINRISLKDDLGPYKFENRLMKENFVPTQLTFRIGGEFRLTKQASLRAGYALRTTPVRNAFKQEGVKPLTTEVEEAGTVPHYEIPNATSAVSAGLGYRFRGGFYTNFAVVYQKSHSNFHLFPTRYYDDGTTLEGPMAVRLNDSKILSSLTLGCKF